MRLCTSLGTFTMLSGTLLASLTCLLATPLATLTNGSSGRTTWTSEQLFPLGEYKHFDCGTNQYSASEHLLSFHKELYHNQTRGGSPAARAAVKVCKASSSPITTDVAFHIVSTHQQDLVQLPWVDQQIAQLNTMYNNYSIAFNFDQHVVDRQRHMGRRRRK